MAYDILTCPSLARVYCEDGFKIRSQLGSQRKPWSAAAPRMIHSGYSYLNSYVSSLALLYYFPSLYLVV